MDHTLALQTNTINKYLLNELQPEERAAFEEHLFDCPECAARVKEDFALISELKEVLREPTPQSARANSTKTINSGWREWFSPLTFIPACAALVLACFAGYQNFVSIPRMLQPQVIQTEPFVSGATRGATTQTALVKPGSALFAASFNVDSPSAHPAYVCEFQSANGTPIMTIDCGKHATAEFTLSLLLPVEKFPPAGYTMILRPASGQNAEVSRYSFAVKNESQ
jgi:hypothetical protein